MMHHGWLHVLQAQQDTEGSAQCCTAAHAGWGMESSDAVLLQVDELIFKVLTAEQRDEAENLIIDSFVDEPIASHIEPTREIRRFQMSKMVPHFSAMVMLIDHSL